MISMSVDASKCIRCGLCGLVCPAGIIEQDGGGTPAINPRMASYCIECGHCVLYCPGSANGLSFLPAGSCVPAAALAMPAEEEALNLLKSRRSTRMFLKKPIPRDVLASLLDTVRYAPTACNGQPVRWAVSEDPKTTAEITNLILCWMRGVIFESPASPAGIVAAKMIAKAKAGTDGLLRGAPQAAVAVVPKEHRWPEDGAIALTYMELAAHAMGLGVCWGGFLTIALRNFEDLRKRLGISEDEYVCGAQLLGYPAVRPVRQFAPRKESRVSWL